MVKLFHSVEAAVVFLDVFNHGTYTVNIVLIAAVFCEKHVVVDLYKAYHAVCKYLNADHRGKNCGYAAPCFFALEAYSQAKKHEKCNYKYDREPDASKSEQLVVGVYKAFKFHFFSNRNEEYQECRNSENELFADLSEISKRLVCKYEQEEAEHKAVSSVEPVGSGKSVPNEIERVENEREKEERDHSERRHLFTRGYLL